MWDYLNQKWQDFSWNQSISSKLEIYFQLDNFSLQAFSNYNYFSIFSKTNDFFFLNGRVFFMNIRKSYRNLSACDSLFVEVLLYERILLVSKNEGQNITK